MATIDLTLNAIKIPALDGYTPPFGTKKVAGGLTTQEVNDNIIAGFLKQRPVEITEDSSTGSVEYNASLVLTTSGLTLTLGAGAYTGCEVKVLFPSGGSMQYTGKTGTVTDALQAGATIRYLWTGTYWKSISCPVEIGDVYTQLPDVAEPAAIYGGQWEEHDYGGMFFRSAGGNAKAFTAPIAGSFTSSTIFAASAALPAGVAAGDLVIAGSEYRTISSISGQNITIDSAFSNFSNITNLMIGQPGTLHLWNWIYDGSMGVNCPGNLQRANALNVESSKNGTANVLSQSVTPFSAQANPYYYVARPNNATVRHWSRIA